MGFMKRIFGGGSTGPVKIDSLTDVKWGTAQPIMVRLADGIGKFRIFGSYSLLISDQDLFKEKCCDPGDEIQINQQKTNFNMTLTRLVADELGSMASGSSSEAISESSEVLSEKLRTTFSRQLEPLGLELDDLAVLGIVIS